MTAANKLGNVYADAAGHGVPGGSKTVWQALAFSLAMRLSEDDWDESCELLADEWKILHEQGIVPQKLVKQVRLQKDRA